MEPTTNALLNTVNAAAAQLPGALAFTDLFFR
jgi:hypothetical protein